MNRFAVGISANIQGTWEHIWKQAKFDTNLQGIEHIYLYIFLIGVHSMQAEQPLRGMELQEKKAQKD